MTAAWVVLLIAITVLNVVLAGLFMFGALRARRLEPSRVARRDPDAVSHLITRSSTVPR